MPDGRRALCADHDAVFHTREFEGGEALSSFLTTPRSWWSGRVATRAWSSPPLRGLPGRVRGCVRKASSHRPSAERLSDDVQIAMTLADSFPASPHALLQSYYCPMLLGDAAGSSQSPKVQSLLELKGQMGQLVLQGEDDGDEPPLSPGGAS